MKPAILLFLLVSNFVLFGQQPAGEPVQPGFAYALTVKTNKGLPDIGRDVVFIETTTYERMAFKTDGQGKLSHHFDHGYNWLGSVGEMRNCIEINSSSNGKGNRTVTYDPIKYALNNKAMPDRRTLDFRHVSQERIAPNVSPSQKEGVLTIVLVDRARVVYPGIEVSVCSFSTKTIYDGRTNANGAVTFRLPKGMEYDIDVDGVESIKRIQLDPRPMNSTMQILFQPRNFKESAVNDLIVQNFKPDVKPSSSHAKIKLKVRGGSKDGIEEDVYVRMLKSNKVYKARTDENGEAILLLPIRQKYFIDFKYQKGAEEIDLSKVVGIAEQSMPVLYTPDPRLANMENFIPTLQNLIDYDIQNFVNKQYPEPENGNVDFYLNWGNKFNAKSKEALLEIGMKVSSKKERKSNIPLNICFVIDKSGSMMGEDRIEKLKESLIEFVRRLDSTDIVSVVVFDHEATVAVPAEKLGDKKKIVDIIHAIQAGGGTLIYNGLEKGFAEVQKNGGGAYVNRVVLLTDGYGSREPVDVIAMAKKNISGGIELSAIGVGVGYNQALLSQLASAGGGLLHLAGNGKNIKNAFQRELESILYAVAKDAMLEVKYNDQIVYRQLFGYSNEVVSPGKMNVAIPHLFPGLDQMALIKFDLINSSQEIERQKVVVTLSYLDGETGEKVIVEKKIQPEWTTATGKLDMTIDKEHKKVLAVAIANQSLKVMAESFENGKSEQAQAAVEGALDQINELFPGVKSYELFALVERLTEYVKVFEQLRMMKQH